jgi:hypothetical protein
LIKRSLAAILVAVGLLEGCGADAAAVERRIVAHSFERCRIDGKPNLAVTALGDFGAGQATADAVAGDVKTLDRLPSNFLGVELLSLPSPGWSGIGYSDPPADVDLTLWPPDDGCDMTAEVPSGADGMAMTAFAGGTKLLVAGRRPALGETQNAAYALLIDLATGERSTRIGMAGLPRPRTFATATPFGSGALVAGGIDPTTDPTGMHPVTAALVFSGETFDNLPLDLGSAARAHHGATVLASGETLLVGGTGEGGEVLATMVAVDPTTRNTRFFGVGSLAFARKDPTVLRLANDQVLVAGGTDRDGKPVSTIEWFAKDGAPCAPGVCPDASTALPPARSDIAFVALAGGGALAAGGFDPPTAADPTRPVPAVDVWWITPEGSTEQLEPLSASQRALGKLRLVAASDGSPWAWTGNAWLQFDPWQKRFLPASPAPSDGPDDDVPSPIAVDPGLFVWLGHYAPGPNGTAALRGFRHGVRGRLTRDAAPLLFATAAHVAPDRPPSAGLVSFEPDGLHLARRITVPAPRVLVTDTIYADFDLSADVVSGPDGLVLPEIEVGGARVGEGACAWPAGLAGSSLEVRRRGTSLVGSVDGTAQVTCAVAEGRAPIDLRAPLFGESVVRKVVVARQ